MAKDKKISLRGNYEIIALVNRWWSKNQLRTILIEPIAETLVVGFPSLIKNEPHPCSVLTIVCERFGQFIGKELAEKANERIAGSRAD